MASIKLFVQGCSACGKSHKIEFNLKPGLHETYPYVGICPKLGEAVHAKIETSAASD